MNTFNVRRTTAWQPKVASLIVPVLVTLLVAIVFFNSLSLYQLVGSSIMLAIIFLSLLVGELKDLPNKDITILWVASILYNAYLISYII